MIAQGAKLAALFVLCLGARRPQAARSLAIARFFPETRKIAASGGSLIVSLSTPENIEILGQIVEAEPDWMALSGTPLALYAPSPLHYARDDDHDPATAAHLPARPPRRGVATRSRG